MGTLHFVRRHSTLVVFSGSLALSACFVACGSDDSSSGFDDVDGGDATASGGAIGNTGGVFNTGGTSSGGTSSGGTSSGGTAAVDASDDVISNGDAAPDALVDAAQD
jgi:hypothetical protein